VTHFPTLMLEVRARLEARGIDPERSAEDFVDAILEGSFPINADGTPARPRLKGLVHGPSLTPIPLAVVLPQ
jgi:hypothetical protein